MNDWNPVCIGEAKGVPVFDRTAKVGDLTGKEQTSYHLLKKVNLGDKDSIGTCKAKVNRDLIRFMNSCLSPRLVVYKL